MNKILFIATLDIHFERFHLPYLQWFREQGWEVHVAARGERDLPFVHVRHRLPFHRSPFRLANLQAYRELKDLMKRCEFDLVHCHTPVGGLLGRLASRGVRKRGARVMYTAHGFHFFRGAPFLNWMLYYPVERLLAGSTDCLITINEEDYALAESHGFRAGQIAKVNGVGVDTERFRPMPAETRRRLRRAAGLEEQEILLFYAAEFNKNKNQQWLIRTLALLRDLPQVKLLLAGDGPLQLPCMELAKRLDLEGRVKFLGYRTDMEKLLPLCDIAVASSYREGLPVNILEAMACGLPILAGDNRGHRELVREEANGFLVPPDDEALLAKRIRTLVYSTAKRIGMGAASRERVQGYSLPRVLDQMTGLYQFHMAEGAHEAESQYHHAYL